MLKRVILVHKWSFKVIKVKNKKRVKFKIIMKSCRNYFIILRMDHTGLITKISKVSERHEKIFYGVIFIVEFEYFIDFLDLGTSD